MSSGPELSGAEVLVQIKQTFFVASDFCSAWREREREIYGNMEKFGKKRPACETVRGSYVR